MSGPAIAASEETQTGRPRTRSHLLRLLAAGLAGGAVLLLWGGTAGASATDAPKGQTSSNGLLTGLVGPGGALTPVIDLVDGITAPVTAPLGGTTTPTGSGTGTVATTVGGVATTVDATLAPVTTPLAPVTQPIVTPVVTTVSSVVSSTVAALPPAAATPTDPGLPLPVPGTDPVTLPGLPTRPDGSVVPGTGTDPSPRPTDPTSDGAPAGSGIRAPGDSAEGATASATGSKVLVGQPPTGSLHGQRSLIARGSAADGAAARTRGDRPLRTRPTFSAGIPAPAPDGPNAPVSVPTPATGAAGCTGQSSGAGSFLQPLVTLPASGARRLVTASTVTPSSEPRRLRGSSDDPGFAPD